MIHICRAEDGQVFQINASLRDIERTGSLEGFLQQETGVDADAVLAYLSDGRRLTSQNLRELAGAQDQSIFVFNKYYLDYDLDDVLVQLKVEPVLQPPIEEDMSATPPFRPSQLAASYLRTAHIHRDHINQLAQTLQYQHEAIRIASSSLDHHILAIDDTFETIAAGARKELEKQASLLAGLESDLALISRVKVHTEFVSPAVRKAIEAGEKHRTLGDYVSNAKMKQVAETCARTHDDLRSRFIQMEQSVAHLTHGAEAVRTSITSTHLHDDANLCLRRTKDTFDKIDEVATSLDSPNSDPDSAIKELKRLDSALRNEVRAITDTKNVYTRQCLTALRQISTLNNDMVQIPPGLTALQTSFRGKNSFSHIQRLHNMLHAYGATVIEIVRRKEFSRFFYQRAQSILEVMAKFSANERKRRQVYRGEIHGMLPFETRGMDDSVPTIDFSPSGNLDAAYSLERDDVDGLIRVLDDLEQVSRSENDPAALGAIQECKSSLEKLINKMDSLESGFDRLAERSLLSASRLSQSRRRSTEADDQVYQDLQEQLQSAEEAKARLESQLSEERALLQGKIHRLQSHLQDQDANNSEDRNRADRLERELHQARAQIDGDAAARRVIDERHQEMVQEMERQGAELARALADATDQAKIAESLRQELAQARAEADEVKALEARNSAKVALLLDEQANNLSILEDARARGEDLQVQIHAARAESEKVTVALREASLEKDRLLRAQASEHDRIMRDHIAEADGDRAVLERQFHELKAVLDHTDRQLKDAKADLAVAHADAVGLRQELQRVEHELREAQHVERLLRDDLKTGQLSRSDFEQHLEDSNRLVAEILAVALAFRASHVKALSSAQIMSSHPSRQTTANSMGNSVFSPSMHHSIIGQPEEASPIDPSDPASALEALRAFDHDHFLEAIAKTGSTIRKWQKQCKEYRERAKGKISFRNFTKGDLALFLPTRNSVSKPWAAFNVSFPHYFLQATEHLAEQLKTREWIVARITSITERIVDQNDPTSNPFGLGDGVKYYMLEVEDWTQPTQSKRKVSSRKPLEEAESSLSPLTSTNAPLPPAPPEAEVEDTFRVTQSPNSHMFPARTRVNSSPPVRPSSLSRLLAQAPVEQMAAVPAPPSPRSPLTPASPALAVGSIPSQISPLRPGSRASRISTGSKFSAGRIPIIGSGQTSGVKGAATTAISDIPMSASPSSGEGTSGFFKRPVTPSPEGSISEGLAGIMQSHSRRRTSSYYARPSSYAAPEVSTSLADTGSIQRNGSQPRGSLTASSALANLASSWGVTFGRKKGKELASLAEPSSSTVTDADSQLSDTEGPDFNQATAVAELRKRL